MLRMISASFCLAAVCASFARGETFPYVAYTLSGPTEVRSGPGEAFYVTDHLDAGQAVEVYRQKGDWCAVRPPEGSFSYVAAEHVEPTGRDLLLRVTRQDATTRVGTRLNDAHNVAYVTLDEGEILKALAPRQTLGGKQWYQIAPPSGEFRWMRLQDLNRTPPEKPSPAAPRELELSRQPQPLNESPSAPEETGTGVQPAAHATAEIPLQKLGEQGSMETFPIPSSEGEEAATVSAKEPTEDKSESASSSSAWTVVDSADPSPPPPTPPSTDTDAAQQLAELNLKLSRTVLRPMGQWKLATLRDQAEELARTAEEPALRDQAAALTRRIVEFDRLEQRHLEITQSEQAAADTDDAAAEPAFAGRGWLIPVITSRRDLPRFALTDDGGKILDFVSSQPGLNLRRYVRQRVGIVGTREENPNTKRSHLVANRVVLLERHSTSVR